LIINDSYVFFLLQVVDLDPEAEVCVKICDLGLSVLFTGRESRGKSDNPRWTAVEVIQNKPYTTKSDVYSFGMLLFEMFCYKMPFDDDSFEFIVESRVIKGDRPHIPETVPDKIANFIQKCWEQVCFFSFFLCLNNSFI
jgi:serine/threonine protein kinase